MTMTDAKTADAITARSIRVHGMTRKQLKMFGAIATTAQLAEELGVSMSTARKRIKSAVAAGIAKKHLCSGRTSWTVRLPEGC